MSYINRVFGDIICICYEDDISSLNKLSNLGLPLKIFDNYGENRFSQHIEAITYAYENNLKNLLVFESTTMPTEFYNEIILCDVINDNEKWDVLLISCDMFNNPTTNAVIYNNSAFEKILMEYNDYIGILEYEEYLLKYSELRQCVSVPFLFYKSNAINWLYTNHDVTMFLKKYNILVIMCVLAYCIKKCITYKI